MDCTLSRWLEFPLPTAKPASSTRFRPLGTVITHSGMGPVGQAPNKFKDLTWLRIVCVVLFVSDSLRWELNKLFSIVRCVLLARLTFIWCFEMILKCLRFDEEILISLHRPSTRVWLAHRWIFVWSNSFWQRHEVCAIICDCAGFGKAKHCCQARLIFSWICRYATPCVSIGHSACHVNFVLLGFGPCKQ